jgi:isorenieratene synthase
MTLDMLKVRVAYRVWGRFCIEVDATFHSPEPRTIVMTIVDGEGAGSVVETHSTPVAPGRSAVIEATLATSDRPGFRYALKTARFIRPFMARVAHKLWIEDVAYAERAYALRQGGMPSS